MQSFILILSIFFTTSLMAAEHKVRIAYNGFLPHVVQIHVGDTVTWVHDSTFHHIVSTDPELFDDKTRVALPEDMESFTSDRLRYGEEFRVTFSEVGTVHYACPIHHDMSGIIIVLPE